MLEEGQTLGRYRVISLLGKGGFGEVYKARDTQLKRDVAVKIFSSLSNDEEDLLRFRQEAHAASALRHQNIITVYDVGEVGSTFFIVTEFVEGTTLRERLRRRPPIRQIEALEIAVQLAGALAAAHKARIVHRDIKPENIMIDSERQIKVLDFGVAKFTGHEAAAESRELVRTESGVLIGTTKYMSPEQLRGEEVDERSDIWSVGVVIYEMMSGLVPFDGPTDSVVSHRVLSEELPLPLARYAPDVSDELHRIVSKSLRKDREKRYQTIRDMLIDLRELKSELERSQSRPPLPEPPRRTEQRQPAPPPPAKPPPTPAGNFAHGDETVEVPARTPASQPKPKPAGRATREPAAEQRRQSAAEERQRSAEPAEPKPATPKRRSPRTTPAETPRTTPAETPHVAPVETPHVSASGPARVAPEETRARELFSPIASEPLFSKVGWRVYAVALAAVAAVSVFFVLFVFADRREQPSAPDVRTPGQTPARPEPTPARPAPGQLRPEPASTRRTSEAAPAGNVNTTPRKSPTPQPSPPAVIAPKPVAPAAANANAGRPVRQPTPRPRPARLSDRERELIDSQLDPILSGKPTRPPRRRP